MKNIMKLTLILTALLSVGCGSKTATPGTESALSGTPDSGEIAADPGSGAGEIVEEAEAVEETAEVEVEIPTFNQYSAMRASRCFLNKMASEGFGQKVYTRAIFRFSKNGRGVNKYRLFADENCEKKIADGYSKFKYEITKTYGEVYVIHIWQQNIHSPKEIVEYWLTAVAHKKGLLMDVDFNSEQSGPFAEEPDEKQTQFFLENAEKVGVLFKVIKHKKDSNKKDKKENKDERENKEEK